MFDMKFIIIGCFFIFIQSANAGEIYSGVDTLECYSYNRYFDL